MGKDWKQGLYLPYRTGTKKKRKKEKQTSESNFRPAYRILTDCTYTYTCSTLAEEAEDGQGVEPRALRNASLKEQKQKSKRKAQSANLARHTNF